MLTYSYYPFKNNLEQIGVEDLLLLKKVSEGWYVDYKSQMLKIVDFSKHMSAFANQYGGWLILGVKENSDGSRTASEFIGVPKSELAKISTDIREASAAHVNPEILYEEKVVDGSIEEIGLTKDNSIIIIGIPLSQNTPHIHSSGRVYRRLADQSKPKEETDRFILDKLWMRGKERKKKLAKLLTGIPKLPISQKNSPWVHIYYKPAEGQAEASNRLTFNDFSEITKASDANLLNSSVPMDAIYLAANGYVARQLQKGNPSRATLSLRWWHDGVARFDIPLNVFTLDSFRTESIQNKYGITFCDLISELGYIDAQIVDYTKLALVVTCLADRYLQMLNLTEDSRDIHSCFTVRNVFYTSPFLDSDKFIGKVRENSLPVVLEKNIVTPREPTDDNMFLHEYSIRDVNFELVNEYQYVPYLFSIPTVSEIFKTVGIYYTDTSELINDLVSWTNNHSSFNRKA